MANKLTAKKKSDIIQLLCEGMSIRGVERITSVHRDTVMRLASAVGSACLVELDRQMQGLKFERLQIDETFSFVGKKEKNVKPEDVLRGSVWTFVAIDPETRVVPWFMCGKRTYRDALAFMRQLKPRLVNYPEIATDCFRPYIRAIKNGFEHKSIHNKNRNAIKANTNYIENQNNLIRTHCMRARRRTNAFSKKYENHVAAFALHFMYYNFVKPAGKFKCPPAMKAGISSSFWTVHDLVKLVEKYAKD